MAERVSTGRALRKALEAAHAAGADSDGSAELHGDDPMLGQQLLPAGRARAEFTGRFVVRVVRGSPQRLVVEVPEPAAQVVGVVELAEVEPVARALLGAVLAVPGGQVPLLVLVDSLHLPGMGPHVAGRAVLVTSEDERAIKSARAVAEQIPAGEDARGDALRQLLRILSPG